MRRSSGIFHEMRITGGHMKGRMLAAPRNLNIRPSSSKVREAIFNIIGQDLSGMCVLDLFSGTGILGIESLSRGAACAVLVDQAKQSISLMKKNLEISGYAHAGLICKWNLSRGLPRNRLFSERIYDLVFMDPPYGSPLVTGLMEELSSLDQIAPGALVVLETEKGKRLKPFSSLNLMEIRHYGDTNLGIFKKKDIS